MARPRRDSLDEDPLESDQDSTDEPDLIDCPFCGEPISELAEICPRCKSYLSREEAAPPRRSRLAVFTVTALIVATLIGYGCIH